MTSEFERELREIREREERERKYQLEKPTIAREAIQAVIDQSRIEELYGAIANGYFDGKAFINVGYINHTDSFTVDSWSEGRGASWRFVPERFSRTIRLESHRPINFVIDYEIEFTTPSPLLRSDPGIKVEIFSKYYQGSKRTEKQTGFRRTIDIGEFVGGARLKHEDMVRLPDVTEEIVSRLAYGVYCRHHHISAG